MSSDSFIGKVSKGNGEKIARKPPPEPPKPPIHIPILRVAVEALAIPIKHFKPFGLSILFFAAIFSIGALAGFSLIETREPGGGSFGLFFSAFFSVLLIMLFVGFLFCGLFSYWIRITMLGPDAATKQSIGNWFSQSLGIFGYNILIVIFFMVLSFFLSFVLMPIGFAAASTGITMNTLYSFGFVTLIIGLFITWVYCWIYASFSTNFVKSALGKDMDRLDYDSSLMESDTMRIAFILLGLYLLFSIFSMLLDAIGFGIDGMVGGILVMIFVIYEIAVFGAAQAISFKLKTKMEE